MADHWLRNLRFGRDRAELTTKSYVGGVALYLRWCAATVHRWPEAGLDLGLFMLWLNTSPLPGTVRSRWRSPARVPRRCGASGGSTGCWSPCGGCLRTPSRTARHCAASRGRSTEWRQAARIDRLAGPRPDVLRRSDRSRGPNAASANLRPVGASVRFGCWSGVHLSGHWPRVLPAPKPCASHPEGPLASGHGSSRRTSE